MLSSIAKAQNDDTILNVGDKAPFYGVLVESDNYRKYTEGLRTEDFINADKESQQLEIHKPDHSLLYGVYGLAIGVAIGILVSNK